MPLASTALMAGTVSELYVTRWNGNVQGVGEIAVIQGNAVVRSWAPNQWTERAIAVSGGTVRTANPSTAPFLGSQYGYAGAFLGNSPGTLLWVTDGATDGALNYGVTGGTGSLVYQFNLDWTNPVVLFDLAPFGIPGSIWSGITYDPATNSLWVYNASSDTFVNVTMDGALISSFLGVSLGGAIAMDYADHTLWVAQPTLFGSWAQFSTGGVHLSNMPMPAGVNPTLYDRAAEFALPSAPPPEVPEPSTLLTGAAGVLLLLWRRKRGRA
jgi:hypothetical protein